MKNIFLMIFVFIFFACEKTEEDSFTSDGTYLLNSNSFAKQCDGAEQVRILTFDGGAISIDEYRETECWKKLYPKGAPPFDAANCLYDGISINGYFTTTGDNLEDFLFEGKYGGEAKVSIRFNGSNEKLTGLTVTFEEEYVGHEWSLSIEAGTILNFDYMNEKVSPWSNGVWPVVGVPNFNSCLCC